MESILDPPMEQWKLWLTRYIDAAPTSEVTPVTIQYIHSPYHDYP